ncbi:MAG: hypothetical protein PVG66_01490 [Chromatiales bacterium]
MKETLVTTLRRYGILEEGPFKWRIIPPVETYPRVVAFAQTFPGKLILFALFMAPMKILSDHLWLWMTLAAILVSFAGRYRHSAALVCTAALLVLDPDWFEYDAVKDIALQEQLIDFLQLGYIRAYTLLACVPVVVAVLWLARRFRSHPFGQRPVLIQHFVFICLLILAASPLLHGISLVSLWSLIAVFAAYFWYLSYALISQRQKQPPSILFHLATFHPFFGSTATPLAKGASNWRDVEAQTSEELAITQLKAVKLIVWAFILKVVLWIFRKVVYELLGVPTLKTAFDQFLDFGVTTGPIGAASILANFFEQLLLAAVWGHVIIATARLAGFRLLRNTWRPLSSRTVAEFWNRYYYYFKEVLVQVYFYPTYVRYFKRHLRLRIAFATFMAAGVGNWFFHFMLETPRIAHFGILDTLIYMQTYAFYCVVLVAGIVISQLRGWRPDPKYGWWRNSFIPALNVMLFYGFLSTFDGPQGHVALKDHFAFLFQIIWSAMK